jgi:hypothetical protein
MLQHTSQITLYYHILVRTMFHFTHRYSIVLVISHFSHPTEKTEADGHSIEDNANLGITVNYLIFANKYGFILV